MRGSTDSTRLRNGLPPSPPGDRSPCGGEPAGRFVYEGVDHPDIEAWVKKASAMIREARTPRCGFRRPCICSCIYLDRGFSKGRGIVESTREWISSSTSYPQRRILFHLFEARLHCGVAQFDDSIRSAARGWKSRPRAGSPLDFLLLGEEPPHSLARGSRFRVGMPPTDGAVPRDRSKIQPGIFHHLSSWHAALKGDIPLALSLESRRTR